MTIIQIYPIHTQSFQTLLARLAYVRGITAYRRLAVRSFGHAEFGREKDLIALSRALEPEFEEVFAVGICWSFRYPTIRNYI